MLVPVAVVGQAIATAALPALTQLWERGRREEANSTLLRALQGGASLGLIALMAFVMLAEPVVEVFYQRGAWTADDTRIVARLLFILALAIPAWVLQQIVVRAFYARGDTWRPMVLGTVIVILAIPFYRGMALRYGVEGLAWAGVVGMWVNFLATMVLARVQHGAPGLPAFLRTSARSAFLAALSGLPTLLILRALPAGALGGFDVYARLLSGALLDIAGAAVLFGRFGDAATRALLDRIRRKLTVGKR
jgi:putative peptidoglycan lipid II flippase